MSLFVARFVAVSTGTSAKTLCQIIPASETPVRVREYRFSFNGTTAADVPILCEILRQSTAGTSSSLTLKALRESDAKTVNATALQTFSAEPTAGDILFSDYVTPVGGLFVMQFPPDALPDAMTSRIALRVTAPQAETVSGSLTIDE